MDSMEYFDNEMNKVSTLLDLLITKPSVIDSMVWDIKKKIMVDNLIRVKACKLWSEAMIKQLESKTSKEVVKGVNELFKIVEVTEKKKWKNYPNH